MSNDSIPSRNPGQTILDTFFNVFKSVLTGNFVARNSTGNSQDESGDLGTYTFRWRDLWFSRTLHIGDPLDEVEITAKTGGLNIRVADNTIVEIDSDGMDGAHLKAGSVPFGALATDARNINVAFSSSGTWVVPAGVTQIDVRIIGGGGGGGGGSGGGGPSSGGGGGGGSGSVPIFAKIEVIPGETLNITVGAGGAAGAYPGGAGGAGSESTIVRASNGKVLARGIGAPGGGGGGASTGGTGGVGGFDETWLLIGGGNGVSGGNGGAGKNSPFGSGGPGGAASGGYPGGGGGGAGLGDGAGGDSASALQPKHTGLGCGGGGGYGGGTGAGVGRAGWNGAAGDVLITYLRST